MAVQQVEVERLVALTIGLLGAAALTALALGLDDRMLGDVGVWKKPLKFQLALALQTGTIAWALTQLDAPARRRAMPRGLWLLWFAVVLFEAGYISLQGGRGVPSHFNRNTALESALGTVMAAGATVLVLTTAWVGGCALMQARRTGWPPMTLAIGLGFAGGNPRAAGRPVAASGGQAGCPGSCAAPTGRD